VEQVQASLQISWTGRQKCNIIRVRQRGQLHSALPLIINVDILVPRAHFGCSQFPQ
jgi:hypothetical protein